MKPRIGCLHAHYSNISYIEKTFSTVEAELLHFVDPALVYRVSSDESFSLSDAERKVKEQLVWMAQANVDAILITCTNYVALLQEDQLAITVPIIKIDEPFFNFVCHQDEEQLLLFTNPATVEGTMKRLNEYATAMGKQPTIEVRVIPDTFELIMQGQNEQYKHVLSEYLREVLAEGNGKAISVAQLSMVEAAKLVQEETGVRIGNPMETLATYVKCTPFKRQNNDTIITH
ncbi:aspartate/glutamate racemase family protein [Cohnella mopanensis]|uniref:aspartate/glutamate racemase family protein n=1 Tax=Cohnella mopanensis TaxID=2911966 RepID=UPI001EF94D35|nr:aspartate/glutamate racemase family protein [Cohnella mopanensis]